ncbi:hypothetical protein MAR_013103 [Mya arenaria]|uniref:Uncharacterized protein n=1 Tax=Mya arenaria TaxID=6604 RepID=A0ABY7G1Y7_MYAAR|nr:hypothetical protein MAR_013103 [Mya arenaria]
MSTAANPYTVPINVTGSFGRNVNAGRNIPTHKKQPLWKSVAMATESKDNRAYSTETVTDERNTDSEQEGANGDEERQASGVGQQVPSKSR